MHAFLIATVSLGASGAEEKPQPYIHIFSSTLWSGYGDNVHGVGNLQRHQRWGHRRSKLPEVGRGVVKSNRRRRWKITHEVRYLEHRTLKLRNPEHLLEVGIEDIKELFVDKRRAVCSSAD